MRKIIHSLLLSLIFTAILPGALRAHAETQRPGWAPDLAGGLAFETKYIWRGQDLVDNPVLQPEASVSKWGLTLSWWGNFDTDSSQQRWTEHDYTIDYTFNIGKASVSLGNIFYIFPLYSGKSFHSEEFYMGFSYDCLLRPWFKWYVDYARGAGSYLQLGVGHIFDLKNGINAKLNATFAYNAGQWGYGYKFAPLLLGGEVNIPLFKYYTVTPNIYYSLALDRSADNDLAYRSEFYGGVKASIAY